MGEDGCTTCDVAEWSHHGLIYLRWKAVNSHHGDVISHSLGHGPQEGQGSRFVLSPTSGAPSLVNKARMPTTHHWLSATIPLVPVA